MKNKLLYTVLTVSITFLLNAQITEQRFSFQFSYGVSSLTMNKLNNFYIDSFALKPNINLVKGKIKKGNQFNALLAFQPNPHFELGFYGSYQYGNSTSNPIIIETDELGIPIKEHNGNSELRTEAISVGMSGTWYIDGLLKWQEKENALNRFRFGIEINGGIGFSKAIIDVRYPTTIPEASFYNFFTSKDFQGQIGLEAEYDITQSPIFTTLGIRLGYQYFRTKPLINRNEITWEVNNEKINLDFSGFYFGTYLKIGK